MGFPRLIRPNRLGEWLTSPPFRAETIMDQVVEIVEEVKEIEVVELTADDLKMIAGGCGGVGSMF